eukprot:SAG31_NODE_8296_length_1478_cov_14.493836_2_plen_398_part_01
MRSRPKPSNVFRLRTPSPSEEPRQPITYDLTARDVPRRLEAAGLPVGSVPVDDLPAGNARSFEELTATPAMEPEPPRPAPHQFDIPLLRDRFPHYDLAVKHYFAQLGNQADAEYYVASVLSQLAPTTAKQYAKKFVEFRDTFCQPRGLCALPAELDTIKVYIGWQARKGTVRGSSLGNYISAINWFHTSVELPPAVPLDSRGHYPKSISAALAGLDNLQNAAAPDKSRGDRTYLPAAYMLAVLDSALSVVRQDSLNITDQAAVTRFRNDVAAVFNYCDFSRSDSGAHMKLGDVALTDHVKPSACLLVFRLRKVKGKAQRRQHAAYQWPPGVLTEVKELFAYFLSVRVRVGCPLTLTSLLWRLPWDSNKATATQFATWKLETLSRRHMSAPGSFTWLGH